MHIPGVYLCPQTSLALFSVMAPFWHVGLKKVRASFIMPERVKLLCAAALFIFLIMMFNYPLTGASSAHMIGTALVSILLGPWAALVAVSSALLVQSVIFADGSMMTLGANAFNMGLVMSFSAYAVFSFLTRGRSGRPVGTILAAFVATYAAVSLCAVVAALEISVSGALTSTGQSLTGAQIVSELIVPNLVIAGPVEALGTALMLYALSEINVGAMSPTAWKRLSVGLALMALLVPVGLVAKGASLGEFSGLEVFLSAGSNLSPLAGYSISGLGGPVGYIASALLGGAAVVFIIALISRSKAGVIISS